MPRRPILTNPPHGYPASYRNLRCERRSLLLTARDAYRVEKAFREGDACVQVKDWYSAQWGTPPEEWSIYRCGRAENLSMPPGTVQADTVLLDGIAGEEVQG